MEINKQKYKVKRRERKGWCFLYAKLLSSHRPSFFFYYYYYYFSYYRFRLFTDFTFILLSLSQNLLEGKKVLYSCITGAQLKEILLQERKSKYYLSLTQCLLHNLQCFLSFFQVLPPNSTMNLKAIQFLKRDKITICPSNMSKASIHPILVQFILPN